MDKILTKLADRMYSKYNTLLEKEDCYDLSEDILEACSKKPEYMVSLKEWINGKTRYHDYILNGFSLVDLACRLDEKTPNIPIAILIFWLEETAESQYRALTVVAHQYCVCDKGLLRGTLCKFAIKKNGQWFFMDFDQQEDTLKECQMWQVLLLNPGLIIQMTYDYGDSVVISLLEDGHYLIETPAEGSE